MGRRVLASLVKDKYEPWVSVQALFSHGQQCYRNLSYIYVGIIGLDYSVAERAKKLGCCYVTVENKL